MYYYIYIQPDIFQEAIDDGVNSLHTLFHILNNIKSNCCLLVYKNGKWNELVKKYVLMISETMIRKKIMTILTYFKKRKMLIYEIQIETHNDFQQYVKQNANEIDVAIICRKDVDKYKMFCNFFTIYEYIVSDFEESRSVIALNGISYKNNEIDQNEFLNQIFYKAIKYAKQIDICDRQMGRSYFSSNYQYTVKMFLNWMSKILKKSNCLICFHTDHPGIIGKDKSSEIHIKNIFDKIIMNSKFSNIMVFLYEKNRILPHNRFIVTDQICLSIERGMDFLDDKSSSCRDVDVNYKDFDLCSDFVKQLNFCNRIQIV